MRWSLHPGTGRRPLLGACVAALALHLFVLSLLQLQRSRQGRPVPLRSRDNTPELLQLSSLPTPIASLEALRLPPSSILPPPPDLLSPAPEGGIPPGSAKRSRRQDPSPFGKGTTARARSASTKASGDRLAASGASPRPASGERDSSGDWAEALGQARALASQEPATPGPASGPSADGANGQEAPAEGPAPVLRIQDPALRDAYQALWSLGRPDRGPSGAETGEGRGAVEVRQVSLRHLRSPALPMRHGQRVVLPEHVLLFWLQGDHLYLLRARRQPAPAS